MLKRTLVLLGMGFFGVFGWANQPPRAESLVLYGETNRLLEITLLAQDPDGDPLSFELLDRPCHGRILGVPPHLTYWPDKDFVGTERFSFQVIDPHGAFDIGFVEIRISHKFASLRIIPEPPKSLGFGEVVEFLLRHGVRTWYVVDIEPRVFVPGLLPFVFAGREARLCVVGPAESPEIREVPFGFGYVLVDFQGARPGTYLLLLVSGTEAFSYLVQIVRRAFERKLAYAMSAEKE